MDSLNIIMWLGFMLSAYAVVGNDSIQTLGTFLTSNEERPWWHLWLYAGGILVATMVYGYIAYDGDVSYERLQVIGNDGLLRYKDPNDIEGFGWAYLLPPLVLMALTRTGIPVSTSFLILTFFAPKGLMDMISKSLLGYVVAFTVAIALYALIARSLSRYFITSKLPAARLKMWTALQWISTGFLWSQWLVQDFANIYVYLPRSLERWQLLVSLLILLVFLAYIFSNKGGKIQEIVREKTNTQDVRSATIIDFTYGLILFFFKELSDIPMSTTWVFLGLLAGREIAIRWRLGDRKDDGDYLGDRNLLDEDEPGFALDADGHVHPMHLGRDTWIMVGRDLAKVALGLGISVALVFAMGYLTGRMSF